MTLQELHEKLQEKGINENDYYLHGLYGSISDEDKMGMIMKVGKYRLEYHVYFKERGQVSGKKVFFEEDEACQYFYRRQMITKDVRDGKYDKEDI